MAKSTGVPSVLDAAIMDSDAYPAYIDANGNPQLNMNNSSYVALQDGWQLINVLPDPKTGDYEAVYQNGLSYYIADRGTTGSSQDYWTDAKIAVGLNPGARVIDLETEISNIETKNPNASICVGGHSLGGEVAAQASEAEAEGGTTIPALILNAPSAFSNSAYDYNVVDIVTQGDGVGHYGVGYSNTITINANVEGGFLNQFDNPITGALGTHSSKNLVTAIANNPGLAQQAINLINTSTAIGGNVVGVKWGGQTLLLDPNQIQATINQDGSVTLTQTNTNDGSSIVATNNNGGDQFNQINAYNGQGQLWCQATITGEPSGSTLQEALNFLLSPPPSGAAELLQEENVALNSTANTAVQNFDQNFNTDPVSSMSINGDTITFTLDNSEKIEFLNGGTGQTVDAGQSGVNVLVDTTGTGGNTLTDDSGTAVLFSTGNDTLMGGSGNDTLIAQGSGNTVTTGSGQSTVDVGGSGNTVNANNATVTLDTGAQANLNGTSNTVCLGSGVAVTENGTGNVINTAANDFINSAANNTINVGGNCNLSGASTGVTSLGGANDTIIGGNDNTLVLTGQNDILSGSGDTTWLASGISVNETCAGNAFNTAANDTVTGTNDTVNVGVNLDPGQSAGVTTINGASNNVSGGDNNTLVVTGQNDILSGSGDTTWLASGISVNETCAGNAFNTAANDTVTGTNDTVNVGVNLDPGQSAGFAEINGANNNVSGGNGNTLVVTGQNDTLIGTGDNVYLSSGVTVTENGNSNAIETAANNTVNAAANNTINVGGNLAAGQSTGLTTLEGESDTVNLAANSGSNVTVTGTNQTVTGDSGNDMVNLAGTNTTATVNGGGYVNLLGSNESLTLGTAGSTVFTAGDTTGEAILDNGGGAQIYTAQGFSGNVTGNSDTVNLLDDSGCSVGVIGQRQTVTGDDGNNSTALIGTGTTATVSGVSGVYDGVYCGAQVNLSNSNQGLTLDSAYSTVDTAANISGASITDNGDFADVSLGNGFSGNLTGYDDTVNMVGNDAINTTGGAGDNITVSGSNNTDTVSGASSIVEQSGTSSNPTGLTLTGTSDAITQNGDDSLNITNATASGDTISVNGSGNTDTAYGASSIVEQSGTSSNPTGLTLTGTSDAITQNGYDSLTISNTASQDTISVSGSGNTDYVYGANSITENNGAQLTLQSGSINNSSITEDGGNVLNINGSATGDNITVNGSGNTDEISSAHCIQENGDKTSLNLTGSGDNNISQNGYEDSLSITGQASGDIINVDATDCSDGISSAAAINQESSTNLTLVGKNDLINQNYNDGLNLIGAVTGDTVTDSMKLNSVTFLTNGIVTFDLDPNSGVSVNDGDQNLTTGNSSAVVNEKVSGASTSSSVVDGTVTDNGSNTGSSSPCGGYTYTYDVYSSDGDYLDTTTISTDPPDDGNEYLFVSQQADPIILNIQGNQVQTQGMSNSAATFDMQNNSQQVQTGWATAGEGMLVYDPNNTNTVTDEANLVAGFGELNSLAQSVDGSNSGMLTSSDALWGSLKVWVDASGTGNFQSGQLETLDQLGITSINLNAATENQNNNGNTILADSTFTYANGSTGDIAGVSLAFNPNAALNQPSTPNASVNNSLDSLISAMAAFAPPTAGQTSLLVASSATYQAPLLAANPG